LGCQRRVGSDGSSGLQHLGREYLNPPLVLGDQGIARFALHIVAIPIVRAERKVYKLTKHQGRDPRAGGICGFALPRLQCCRLSKLPVPK